MKGEGRARQCGRNLLAICNIDHNGNINHAGIGDGVFVETPRPVSDHVIAVL